jgi:hypothetical protein
MPLIEIDIMPEAGKVQAPTFRVRHLTQVILGLMQVRYLMHLEVHKPKFHAQENCQISKRYAFLISIFDSFEALK